MDSEIHQSEWEKATPTRASMGQPRAASSVWPDHCCQLVTTKSILPTHHCQITTGLPNTANLAQGQLATGGWRENQMDGRASECAECRAAAESFPFSHFPRCHGANLQAVQNSGGRWQQWVGWVVAAVGFVKMGSPQLQPPPPMLCPPAQPPTQLSFQLPSVNWPC